MKIRLSVIVLAKNEEKNIKNCLESLKWCDEIIIIDDNSSDKTTEIAKEYKAKIYTHALDNNFSAQRNFGISKTSSEWALFIDADEIVSDALAYEVSNVIHLMGRNSRDYDGFYIRRADFMWGKRLKYGETGNAWRLRLAKKTAGKWEWEVHEVWKVKGLIGKLVNPIFHYPHGGKLEEFIREVNFYTDIKASELFDKKVKVIFWIILLYPLGKFLNIYFLKRGFMDGIRGLILAIMMSFHSFLVRGKLWLMCEKWR